MCSSQKKGNMRTVVVSFRRIRDNEKTTRREGENDRFVAIRSGRNQQKRAQAWAYGHNGLNLYRT